MAEYRATTVFITGADRGLGYELTRQMLAAGCHVFAGRYMKQWTLLDDLQSGHPDQLDIVDIDVGQEASVKTASDLIRSKTDKLDILINNAAILGRYEGSVFGELDFDDMLKCFNINALGALRVSQALIREIMNSHNKLIVNISSEAGSIGTCWRYEGFGYCMAKAAMNMQAAIIHNSIHREFNGQVLNVHPGGMLSLLHKSRGPETPVEALPDGQWFMTAEKSARHITELIMDQERFKSNHPAFVNYRGDSISW